MMVNIKYILPIRNFSNVSFELHFTEVARENPTINLNFQRFENYQLAKTSKCQEEIKAIDMEMQKIREQARESRQNN